MLRTDDHHHCHNPPIKLDPQARQETRQIARELAAIARSGELLPGTLTERAMRCGRAGCACHKDPPRLHGPYWQWTRKVNNKTVTRWLSREQATDLRRSIDNDHRIRELIARLEAIATANAERAQRQHQHAARVVTSRPTRGRATNPHPNTPPTQAEPQT